MLATTKRIIIHYITARNQVAKKFDQSVRVMYFGDYIRNIIYSHRGRGWKIKL